MNNKKKQNIKESCDQQTIDFANGGEFYAWGLNGQGQIGHGCKDNQLIPIKNEEI
jgi:hypothetical protein